MLITSEENKKIKYIKKLNQKKYRDEYNEFLVEGEHLVLESYKNSYLKEIIVLDGFDFKLDVETTYVTNNILNYISDLDNPPKVLGICKKINPKTIGNRVIVLDNVQDPGNLGTIIRSAVAFNIDTIILSEDTVDLYNTKVLRATQGMIFSINIIIGNLEKILNELKDKNYKIFGTKVTYGKSIKSIEKCEKFAIIVGNEGKGVNPKILDICNDYVYIKMNDKCESLNVGVAASIIMYELDK